MRHDRYGGRRRGVAPGVLRGRRRRRTAEQAEHPQGRPGPAVPDGRPEERGAGQAHRRGARDRAADPDRYAERRGVRAAERKARGGRDRARRTGREERRRGGGDHRRGRSAGHGDRVDADGRPRYGYPARWSRRDARKGKAIELGGLYVIGTGLHASRRLDDQLRGRAGRQGDPGGTLFFAALADELVTRYSVSSGLRPHPDSTGRLTDRKSLGMLEHAQRVADGANAELHRTTWQYNRLTGQQRAILLDPREKVLTEDLAATELASRAKERYDELIHDVGEDVVKAAARRIALRHLDRRWTDHLAYLADLREGIHLRSLAGGIVHLKPIDEFNKSAIASFDTLIEDAWKDAAETFGTAEITAEGLDEEASGIPRPTATWTYLVNDNPFGTEADRILGRLRNAIKPESAAEPEEILDEHFDEDDLPEELRDAEDDDLPEELREMDEDDELPEELRSADEEEPDGKKD